VLPAERGLSCEQGTSGRVRQSIFEKNAPSGIRARMMDRMDETMVAELVAEPSTDAAAKSCELATVCPDCGVEMSPEHAHYRCPSCGYRDSCCF